METRLILPALTHAALKHLFFGVAILAFGGNYGLVFPSLLASESPTHPPKYAARTWQTDDGLPRNTINAIGQTPDGYLWLGTPFGVIRFDGVTFTPMEGGFYPGFARSRTRLLYTDALGRLWIGTGTKGIIRYDGRSFVSINNSNGLPHPTVTAICEDSKGKIWVGCQDGSLAWLDSQDQAHPVKLPSQNRGAIQLVRDGGGKLWFAQGNVYGQLIDGSATNTTVLPNSWINLCPSRDGGMWITAGTLLKKLPPPESKIPAETTTLPDRVSYLPVVIEDHTGDLWIGTSSEGVFRYSDHKFIREFSTPYRILALFQDSEANIWVGTEGGGLNRLQPQIFRTISAMEKGQQASVLSVCEAANGDIWLTGHGAELMRWTTDERLETVPGFANAGIGTTCVLPQSENGVWVGTIDWGLISVDESKILRKGNWPDLQHRQIRALYRDAKNQLWIGCHPDGLIRITATRTNLPEYFFYRGLPRSAIWSLADDREGNLWLGTINGDLLRYNGTNFTTFGTGDGLPGTSIGALHFSTNGDLWIGTLGGGLGRFRDKKCVFAGARAGLTDDVITGIAEDDFGYFWLSTDRGIVRVLKSDLDAFADGKINRFNCVHFGKSDGLANVECIGGQQPSSWRTRAGDIWFATSQGGVVVNPAAIPKNNRPPKPVLEKVLLDDRDITDQRHPVFAYGYRKLDFVYTAPSFTAPEQIRFRHQLLGLETNWVEDATLRSASYPRLAPGRYLFRVSAANRDGAWAEPTTTFSFEVTPAYWQTTWFRLTGLLLFGAFVWGVVRYRYVQKLRRKTQKLEQERAVEQERVRIARDIHDDLGARLTQMAFLSDLVASDTSQQSKARERLETLAGSSRDAIRSLDEIVWAVDPRKDTLPEFVDYLGHHASEFFRTTQTPCRQDLPLTVPNLPLPTDFRHHLFLACKEALNNASKYARATEVRLKLAITGSDLEIIIEDNGRGFAPAASADAGNGLANMNNRLVAIGGISTVESQPDRGTCVRFCVKLPFPADAKEKSIHNPPAN